MPAAVTYTFTNTEVADATKINKNYDDLVDAINDFDGGTASDTQRLALPKAGTSTLNALTRKEALIFYDTDEGKIKVDDGVNLKAVGGGLVPISIDLTDFTSDPKEFTAEAGKHYIVNMDTAAEQYKIVLPEGANESAIRITVINNDSSTYPLTIEAYGTETIFYNDTENDDVDMVYEEQWAEFTWDATHWVVDDNSNVLSGTFSGSLDFTGGISFNGGDQLSYYDEGTWTPSLAFSGGGGSFVYSEQYGHYTRIGRLVVANIFVSVGTGSSNGTGTLKVSLPFAVANLTRNQPSAGVSFYAWDLPDACKYVVCDSGPSESYGYLWGVQDNNGTLAVGVSTTPAQFNCTLIYFTE